MLRSRTYIQEIVLLLCFLFLIALEYVRILPGIALYFVFMAGRYTLRARTLLFLCVIRDVLLFLPLGLSALFLLIARLVTSRIHGTARVLVSALSGSLMILVSNWFGMREVTMRSLAIPCLYFLSCVLMWVRERHHDSIEQLYESAS